MEGEILNAIKQVKNISKKQATFARIYPIMKKTHKNLTENELENVIDNMVDKTIIISVTNLIPFLILVTTQPWRNKRKTLMKMLRKHPPLLQDNGNLIEETQLQDERYEITDKDITETCDIATKFILFEEF